MMTRMAMMFLVLGIIGLAAIVEADKSETPHQNQRHSAGGYLYPKSCQQYFQKNPRASSPATVTIDLDGPAITYSPTTIMCTYTGTRVCSNIAPNTPTLSRGTCVVGAGPITGLTGTAPALPISATSNTYFVCGNNFQPVSYPATTAFITGLISVSAGTCSQTVTVNCQNGGAPLAQDNNLFVAIKQNAVSNAVVYNVFDTAIVEGAGVVSFGIRAFNGVCDCASLTVNPCSGKCKCSALLNANAQDTDTITLYLSAAKPNWVESVLLGEDDNTADAPAADAFNPSITHTATVGSIQCCENMYHPDD